MNENEKGRKTEVTLKRNNRSQILLPFFEIESQLYKSSHFHDRSLWFDFTALRATMKFHIYVALFDRWKVSEHLPSLFSQLLHRVFHVGYQKLLIIQCLSECRSKYWSIESNSTFTDITVSDIKITRWIIIKQ